MWIKGTRFNQDVLAGLIFIVFGAFFVFFAKDYKFGTAVRMGPGYLPTILGWALIAVGGVVAAKGALAGGERLEINGGRPLLFVCGTFLIFSWAIADFGLIVTAILCVLFSAYGGPEFRLKEQLYLAITAAAVTALGFIWALGLPMRMLPTALGTGY